MQGASPGCWEMCRRGMGPPMASPDAATSPPFPWTNRAAPPIRLCCPADGVLIHTWNGTGFLDAAPFTDFAARLMEGDTFIDGPANAGSGIVVNVTRITVSTASKRPQGDYGADSTQGGAYSTGGASSGSSSVIGAETDTGAVSGGGGAGGGTSDPKTGSGAPGASGTSAVIMGDGASYSGGYDSYGSSSDSGLGVGLGIAFITLCRPAFPGITCETLCDNGEPRVRAQSVRRVRESCVTSPSHGTRSPDQVMYWASPLSLLPTPAQDDAH